MSDLILSTPAEFTPWLAVIGLVMGALITLGMSLYSYSEYAKTEARAGSKVAYGMGYLSKNIVVIIVACIAAIAVPGMYYDLVAAAPTEMGCYLIGFVAAVIVAIGGENLCTKFLETIRNRSKAKDALSEDEAEDAERSLHREPEEQILRGDIPPVLPPLRAIPPLVRLSVVLYMCTTLLYLGGRRRTPGGKKNEREHQERTHRHREHLRRPHGEA